MPTEYAHTNIISQDWEKLAKFYINVFDCKPLSPERDESGEWLEKGTAVKNAHLKGVHLRLPGCGDDGPTLEIYSYHEMLDKPARPAANRKGLGHLAFRVDDVKAKLDEIVHHGGHPLGDIVTSEVEGAGTITFTYATDPEGNIIEVQNWK